MRTSRKLCQPVAVLGFPKFVFCDSKLKVLSQRSFKDLNLTYGLMANQLEKWNWVVTTWSLSGHLMVTEGGYGARPYFSPFCGTLPYVASTIWLELIETNLQTETFHKNNFGPWCACIILNQSFHYFSRNFVRMGNILIFNLMYGRLCFTSFGTW